MDKNDSEVVVSDSHLGLVHPPKRKRRRVLNKMETIPEDNELEESDTGSVEVNESDTENDLDDKNNDPEQKETGLKEHRDGNRDSIDSKESMDPDQG